MQSPGEHQTSHDCGIEYTDRPPMKVGGLSSTSRMEKRRQTLSVIPF